MSKFPCVRTQISGALTFAGLKPVEIPQSGCGDHGLRRQRPCLGFLFFLNFRLLRCRLVSLTSVLKDSVSAADISSTHPPTRMYPASISSLPELNELHDSVPRGAGSPEASPVSSSLSMGTMPRDDQSALVSSYSDPDPPLNPTVDSDPDDDCCVTCWDHSGLKHMPSIANPFATSFPCTLTCAGTCSHLTSLPGFAISWSKGGGEGGPLAVAPPRRPWLPCGASASVGLCPRGPAPMLACFPYPALTGRGAPKLPATVPAARHGRPADAAAATSHACP